MFQVGDSAALGAAFGRGAEVVAAVGAEAGFDAPTRAENRAEMERGGQGEQQREGPVGQPDEVYPNGCAHIVTNVERPTSARVKGGGLGVVCPTRL